MKVPISSRLLLHQKQKNGGGHTSSPAGIPNLSNDHSWLLRAGPAITASGHRSCTAGIHGQAASVTARIDWNLTADRLRHTAGLADHDLTWDTASLGDVAGLTDIAAGGVRNLAVTDLLGHRAGGVRNLFRTLLTGPGTGRVRNLTAHSLASPAASGVRNLLRTAFTSVGAGGVRNLLRTLLASPAASRVRNLLRVAVRHATADRVRHLAVLGFRDPTSAADLTGHSLGAPDLLAANARRTLNLLDVAATGLVDAAAVAFIPAERTWSFNAAVNNWTRNAFLHDLPFAALDVFATSLGDRTAGRVAHIAVAGLGLAAVTRAADIAVASLVARLANRVAHRSVAGLIARLANRVSHVAIASLVAGLANLAADGAIARLVTRLANVVAHRLVAGLITRLADGVALIPIAGLANNTIALNGHLFVAGIHDGLAFLIRLSTPDGLFHRLIAAAVTGAGLAVVLTGLAAFSRATSVAADTAEEASLGFRSAQQREGCH